jgi:hypothetical protein
MWSAFKLLSLKAKLGVLGLLAIVAASLLGSAYFIGYNKGVNIAAAEINRYQIAAQRIQNDVTRIQTEKNTVIVTKYRDRVEYVDRIQYKTRTIVEQSVPEQFNLSRGWIYAYNQSVRGLELDPTKAADATPSSVTEMRALAGTLIPNNGICLKNQALADSLQAWVKSTEATREEATK